MMHKGLWAYVTCRDIRAL